MTRVSQATGTPSQTDRSNDHQHHTTRPRAGFFFGDGSDASVTHSLSYASSRKALCSKGFRGVVTDMTDISHIPEYRARTHARQPSYGRTRHIRHLCSWRWPQSLIWRGFVAGDAWVTHCLACACCSVLRYCHVPASGVARLVARGTCILGGDAAWLGWRAQMRMAFIWVLPRAVEGAGAPLPHHRETGCPKNACPMSDSSVAVVEIF